MAKIKKLLYRVWSKNRSKGFSLVECTIAIAVLLVMSGSLLVFFSAISNFYRQATLQANSQAELTAAMEIVLREARDGQEVYGEKLPNSPPSLVIWDDYSGRQRQVRYRLSKDPRGNYSLLREVAYPGVSGYQGHNPIARNIVCFEIVIENRFLGLTMEDSFDQTLTQGTALRNLSP